jgi:hypothetical protein
LKDFKNILLLFIISLLNQACFGQVHLEEHSCLEKEELIVQTVRSNVSFPDSLSLPLNIFSAIFQSNADYVGFKAQTLSLIQRQPASLSPINSAQLLLAPIIELPEIPFGFFCKFEDQLSRKWFPIDFGTD